MKSAKKRIMTSLKETSIHDLVPANLAKARGDAVPVISAKYTKVGESLRRNAPNEVRYENYIFTNEPPSLRQ